jgi:2-phosphosulfolactate phosphatase
LKIDVFFAPQPNYKGSLKEKVVVVLDILRATSTIVTALGNKAAAVVPVIEPEDADNFAKKFAPENVITGGERKGFKIHGFELGNSPLEYTEAKVGEKTIILCTSNGTRAINWARDAGEVLIGSYLNLQNVVSYLAKSRQDVVLVCSGREGVLSLEDLSCAGMIVAALNQKIKDLEMTDTAKVAMYASQQAGLMGLREFISQTDHGRDLKELGMEEDLSFCVTVNRFNILPRFQEGQITI